MNPNEPLAIELLLTEDQRRPMSVAGHHEWRESIESPARDFDEVDELVAELRDLETEGTEL